MADPINSELHKPRLFQGGELRERRLARKQEEIRQSALREAHFALARDLKTAEPAALAALSDAHRMVDLWEANKTCSPFYINSWRQLLSGTPEEVSVALSRMDPKWESALIQNTPFGHYVKSFSSLEQSPEQTGDLP
ncbi:MAG: hypothetical protein ACKVQK_29050 [Burkholderiales bacterium]